MEPLLKIRNLRVSFTLEAGKLDAVSDVSLDIAPGETLVLAGESGSGKTVTALSIARILPAGAQVMSGSIEFGGRDMLALSENELTHIRGKEIAYIFQEPTSYLNPVFTVGAQIAEALILHQGYPAGRARAEVLRLLDLVRIADPERVSLDYPHQLSGGMNQRIFIAMSLACRPRLLVADEPTTALDVTIESEILRLLMELKERFGFSLLFITHNLSIARKIADRVSVMQAGRVVEEGTVESLFGAPRHRHTQELIRAYEKIGRL